MAISTRRRHAGRCGRIGSMAKPKFADRSLIELCTAAAGGSAVSGGRAALRLLQWATVAEAIGHFPTIEEYASWTRDSVRTANRRRSEIRQVFTEAQFRELVEQLVEKEPSKLSRSRLSVTLRVAS